MTLKRLIAAVRPYAKAVTPAALAVAVVVVRWAITGGWDAHQWDIAITGLAAATITYFVPNANLAALGIHPAAIAADWLGQRPVPDVAPILPDENEDTLHARLEQSASTIGEQEIRPLEPGQAEPPERTGPVAMTRSRVDGLAVAASHAAVSHTRHYETVAGQHGCRKGLAVVIIECARRRGVAISLGFALINHESGFRKIFGHDPTIYVGAGLVTRVKYLAYRARRIASGNRLMQGVAEPQLTWWATQDAADARGGCWKAEAAIDTAFITLAANIHAHGYVVGIERYNGSGPAAVAYSHAVRAQAAWWHHELTEGLR
jgi:hypothetical protein